MRIVARDQGACEEQRTCETPRTTIVQALGELPEVGAAAKAGVFKIGDELVLVNRIDVRAGKHKLVDILDRSLAEHEFVLARAVRRPEKKAPKAPETAPEKLTRRRRSCKRLCVKSTT